MSTSEGKLCDLGKQNDSLPFPLISQNKLTGVITRTNDNKSTEAAWEQQYSNLKAVIKVKFNGKEIKKGGKKRPV